MNHINKLYALIITFLVLPVCAMENEQPNKRVTSFFNGGHPYNLPPTQELVQQYQAELSKMTSEQQIDWHFNYHLESWNKAPFNWRLIHDALRYEFTKDANEALDQRMYAITVSACNYSAHIIMMP